jgi:hypothetical protein
MIYQAERGVLYVAYGDAARHQAGISIRTLRKIDRDVPVAMVCAEPFPGVDIEIIETELDLGARMQKTRMYTLSPFERTLFLDADTEVISTTAQAFGLLDHWDVVLGQDPKRRFADVVTTPAQAEERRVTRQEIGTDEVMHYNSGVFAFRRDDRVQAMMACWHEEWKRWQMTDQMALLRALHKCPVRVAAMRWCWNTHREREARFIFHKYGQARRVVQERGRSIPGKAGRREMTAAMRRNLGLERIG